MSGKPLTEETLNKIKPNFPFSQHEEKQKLIRKYGFKFESIIFTGQEIESIRLFMNHKTPGFIHPLEMECDHHPLNIKNKISLIKNKTNFFTHLGYVIDNE